MEQSKSWKETLWATETSALAANLYGYNIEQRYTGGRLCYALSPVDIIIYVYSRKRLFVRVTDRDLY